jgi:hypothetical protein
MKTTSRNLKHHESIHTSRAHVVGFEMDNFSTVERHEIRVFTVAKYPWVFVQNLN